jgi:hypothetical protein
LAFGALGRPAAHCSRHVGKGDPVAGDLDRLEGAICLTGIEPDGGCAAYLAEASLMGEAAKAWAVVEKRNLRKAEQIEFKSFAGAVRWFLWRHGYDPAVEPSRAAGPSVSCRGRSARRR